MSAPSPHHVTVNNLRIHYTEAGSGPPVLLIHGFPTSSHLWRNVIPELAKTHRAIAIDLPGYGLSDKPLDVTYDFAFFWAVRHPERVKQLVILNTLVYPETSWPSS
jgi:haloalkane dehalogenase